ncbi:aminotransferase class I/II-fold pyridoxal phosphate-dependent enzyme [Gammaproteobacteria bacterium]|nr:aminotransferase class I/II-fold pyridoxal phosphate-dependent enzyme [Gammaproteobacteria bacterium]
MLERMLAKGATSLEPFKVMQISDWARELENKGRSIVHFEIGEPDFPTAQPIVERAKKTLDEQLTKYSLANGMPELREKISRRYAQLGATVDPKQIILTNGASGGLLLLLGGLLNPEDKLMTTDPGYPCNGAFASTVGASLKKVELSVINGFQPYAPDFEKNWDATVRGVLFASPMNPTGTIISKENLKAVWEICDRKNGFLIVDEIYQGITHGYTAYQSAIQINQDIFILNSFSKYFCMTGWRLGWILVPVALADHFIKLAQHLFISPNTISQHAAIEAFSDDCIEIHDNRAKIFRERLKVLSQGLVEMGFSIPVQPEGGFYLFVDISHTGIDSQEFCSRILREFGVAITPAYDFSEHYAADYVRFSCSTDLDSINEGLNRISSALVTWGL